MPAGRRKHFLEDWKMSNQNNNQNRTQNNNQNRTQNNNQNRTQNSNENSKER